MDSVKTPPSVVPSPSPNVPLAPSPAWTSSTHGHPSPTIASSSAAWTGRSMSNSFNSIPEGANIHVDYDGKDLEITSLSPIHDVVKKTLARFVELTAEELEIPCTGLGQTTWKRPEVVRGLEADDCYYFAPEKLAVADEAIVRWSKDVAEYPNPDLAIEVDVSPSKIDRPAIYAALRVAEVWRFDGERKQIVIERLSEDGTYRTVDMSEFLPVRSEEVVRWVLEEDRRAGSAWGRRSAPGPALSWLPGCHADPGVCQSQTPFQRAADSRSQGRIVPWIDMPFPLSIDDIALALADFTLDGLLDNRDSVFEQVNAGAVLGCRLDRLRSYRRRIDICLHDGQIAYSFTAKSSRNSRGIAIANRDNVLSDRTLVVDQLDIGKGDSRVGNFAQRSIDFLIRFSRPLCVHGGRCDIEVPQTLLACLDPESHADIKAITDDLTHEPSTIVELAPYQNFCIHFSTPCGSSLIAA